MYSKLEKTKRNSWFYLDEIFVWGIICAPMTALRLFKFGPGEILLIIWMIAVFYGNNPSTKYANGSFAITDIGRYQLVNLFMMIIGMIVNIVIYHETLSVGIVAVNLFSHLFMFLVSSCMIVYFEERDLEDINGIIQKIVIRGAVVYAALLVYATFINTRLFGIKLWLGGRGYRFLGLAGNPHQIGMITGVGVCFSLYLLSVYKKKRHVIIYIVTAIIWFWISTSLQSDTLTLSYPILATTIIILKLLKTGDNQEHGRINKGIVLIVLVIVLIVCLPQLWRVFSNYVTEAGNGLGRIKLWQSGLGQFREKPLCVFTGMGPSAGTGTYMKTSGNEVEAHNTYIQQILNSGIFVCLYYVIMIIRLISKPMKKNTYLIAGVLYYVLYGFGGNMNRRVLVWVTYSMAMILFLKTEKTEIASR